MPYCGNYLWSSLELIKETVINHKAYVDIATNTTGIRFNLRESKQVTREHSGKMSLPVHLSFIILCGDKLVAALIILFS